MQWQQNWHQPPDMFGFISLTEYWNHQSRTHKYENMKIDLKLAYNHTLNTLMGLLRWSHLLFEIKTASHIFHRKATTVRQILRTMFTRNGVPKTIVTDNALEFCNDSLVLWLRKIGCMPYKTPPYHPQSNDIAKSIVQMVKMGLKAFSPFNQNIEAYIPNLLLSYWTVPHVDRKQSPSALMGKQIRAPIIMSFATEEKVWYERNKEAGLERAKFILQKGQNTAVLEKKRATNISSCWPI